MTENNNFFQYYNPILKKVIIFRLKWIRMTENNNFFSILQSNIEKSYYFPSYVSILRVFKHLEY